MRKNKGDRHLRKTVTFRIPADLMEALRDLAQRNRRPLWREARLAIQAHLTGNGNSGNPKKGHASP